MKQTVYTIQTAAEAVKRTPQYVRHAIRKGTLKSTLMPIEGRIAGARHTITQADLDAWRKNIGTRTANGGAKKYNVWLTDEQLAALPKTVKAVPAYNPAKSAAYRAKKVAVALAAKDKQTTAKTE